MPGPAEPALPEPKLSELPEPKLSELPKPKPSEPKLRKQLPKPANSNYDGTIAIIWLNLSVLPVTFLRFREI